MSKRIFKGGTYNVPPQGSFEKIDVFMRQVGHVGFTYLHSTNRFKSCADAARNAADGKGDHLELCAWRAV